MKDTGEAIKSKGANVLYWNWQEKARTKVTDRLWNGKNDKSCIDVSLPVSLIYPPTKITDYSQMIEVPFDETEESGKYLAGALNAVLKNYNQKIHFIGHSLGTLVSTYAIKHAKEKKLQYADLINHLVFLDSPCYNGIPGGKEFLEKNKDSIFWENYMSQFGRPYKYADIDVWLQPKAIGLNPLDHFTAHGYSHEWYKSSVTNFSDKGILGDSFAPSSTLPWGFYWWKENTRINLATDYSQTKMLPHYLLDKGNAWDKGWELVGDIVIDVTGAYVDASVEMVEQIEAWAKLVGKTVKVVGIKTYSTATDVADAEVDTSAHAVYNATFGFLTLVHSSTAVLDIPVAIPAGANALTFGMEFLYGETGSMLEVFVNGNPVYHTTSELAMTEGLKMIPWIDVEQFAGQTVTISLRLSNPNADTEGKIKIDDLIVAKIEDPDVPDGDYNNDGTVNLNDTILALQVVSGLEAGNRIYRKAGVKSEDKIGMAEVIYSLQRVAGLRDI